MPSSEPATPPPATPETPLPEVIPDGAGEPPATPATSGVQSFRRALSHKQNTELR
jgi:hypothetical protein